MPASPADLELLAALAAEFGLGQVTGATPMPGHPHVVRVTTRRGAFLVRPAVPADPALYEQVARTLDQAGIRQAMPLRTTAGSLVSATGLVVQEFLPGTALLSPSPAQTLAAMRHIAASLDAAGPWTSAERAAWPAMLVLEALRRLATPFAVAAESGGSPAGGPAAVLSGGSAAVRRRLDAVVAIARDLPRLSVRPAI